MMMMMMMMNLKMVIELQDWGAVCPVLIGRAVVKNWRK